MKRKTAIQSYVVNLKDYTKLSEISKGGFGQVFLVQKKDDQKQYAAKVSFPQRNSTDHDKYLSREIGILIRVQAPTIIRFYGFSFDDFRGQPNPTIIMKYYKNGSLRRLIQQEQNGECPVEYNNTTKQIILCGIAHGMMTLHLHRVLHRDLKSDNILLDENYHPYITDFGLSKFLDNENSTMQSMAGCGTFTYMSPETFAGTRYNSKSDVYSFGILMYEIITGKIAFSEDLKKKKCNPFFIPSRVAKGERPEFVAPIKPALRNLIERCWAQDPTERPTFREIFNKLSLSLEEEDETVETCLREMISKEKELKYEDDAKEEVCDNFPYLLTDVDIDTFTEYIDHITSKPESELSRSLEQQIKRLDSLEQEHQQKIDQLQSQIAKMEQVNVNNQSIIEQLQSHIAKMEQVNASNQSVIEQLQSKINALEQPKGNANPAESLNGLSLSQIKEKIKKEKLTKITIPSSITSIEPRAFYNCKSLTQIIIPSSVISIGDNAFESCTSLKSIIIPSSVESIGRCAFVRCTSLKKIAIPSTTSISDYAFLGCSEIDSNTRNQLEQTYGIRLFQLPSSFDT